MMTTEKQRRRAAGIYYTPARIVEYLVPRSLGRHLRTMTPDQAMQVRILDPSCGAGVFLSQACRYLLAWYRKRLGREPDREVRRTILRQQLFGIDIDATAVAATRATLHALLNLDETAADQLHVGNALIGSDFSGRDIASVDWTSRFPEVFRSGGFDVILGNPPWGQKGIEATDAIKRYLWKRFPSSGGIFDWFRPFVELSVRLTQPGGRLALVLPDIILLKNYPLTRQLLLDEMSMERIDTWGRAFPDAVIDTVSIIGRREPPPAEQQILVSIREHPRPLRRTISQADFRTNPRQAFNLYMTPGRRHILNRLADYPRLGVLFEVHEGVHSGNMRAELFVSERLDETCRELLFGRDEIQPYRLHWRGRFLHLAAATRIRPPDRYANLGRPEWYERDKLLIRRTGDRLLAAVDRLGRRASNNFFVVFPRQACALDLDGLCALLNSTFMTWYFRAIEPRHGRVFAELKIKHLTAFPLPLQAPLRCGLLNELGRRRTAGEPLDDDINRLVNDLFGILPGEVLQ